MKYIIDIDKLPCNNGKNCTTCPFWSMDDTCEIKEQVKKLPKYEERPHGEWIESTQGYFCSKCNEYDRFYFDHNFCPNCGADMRDKKDDLADIGEAVQSMKEGETE